MRQRGLLLFGLVLVFSTGIEAMLLGSNRCTWGPSYWCAHFGTMKECKSGSYCSRLWQRGPAVSSSPDSSPEDCSFCRLLGSDLERLSRANRTSEESRRLATSACGLVRESRLRSLCLAVVENYIDEATQLLREGLTVDRLCSALSLCGGGRRDPRLHVAMEMPAAKVAGHLSTTSLCDYCIELTDIEERAYGDMEVQTELAQRAADALCPAFPIAQSVCKTFIDYYVPAILQHLASQFLSPRQLCVNATLCPPMLTANGRGQQNQLMRSLKDLASASLHENSGQGSTVAKATLAKPDRVGESLCMYCVEFMDTLKRALLDRSVAGEVRMLVSQCFLLNRLRADCERWMEQHFADVLWMLGSEIDPRTTCTNATACRPTEDSQYNRPPPETRKKSKSSDKTSRATVLELSQEDGLCDLCKVVVTDARQMLSDSKTRSEILDFIKNQLCGIVPEDKDKCDQAVDTYGPIILQMLLANLDPVIVCQVIGLCSNNATNIASAARTAAGPLFASTCTLCQEYYRLLQLLFQVYNATGAASFERYCNLLPAPNRTDCRIFMEKYAVEIVVDIDPYRLCQGMTLCPPKPTSDLQQPLRSTDGQADARPLRYHGNERPVAPIGGGGRNIEEPMI